MHALEAVLRVCHHVVMSPQLNEEWGRHAFRSRYASKWYNRMHGKKKVDRCEAPDESLGMELARRGRGPRQRLVMEKDAHLIDAAIEGDGIVLSCDEEARQAFAAVAMGSSRASRVLWANPSHSDENVVAWIEAGAPDEARRRLGNYRKP